MFLIEVPARFTLGIVDNLLNLLLREPMFAPKLLFDIRVKEDFDDVNHVMYTQCKQVPAEASTRST